MRYAPTLAPLAAIAAAVTGVAIFALSRPAPAPPRTVKLAVLVVFDQMRADYLERWQPQFRADGFARFQRDGAWFTNCHYPYAVTHTGPGHASMLTGAAPDRHGIIANTWHEGGHTVNCVNHTRYKLVPPAPKFEPDPSDKEKPPAEPTPLGTPERLLSETVADVLKEATAGRAKVFGLSLKDRSAILPTGQRPDGAYWFYGTFGTSTYYTETIHDTGRVHPWVAAFNSSGRANRWFGHDWTRFRPDLDYVALSGPDDVRGEGGGYGQGPIFPHPTTGGKRRIGPKYYDAIATSPFGNDLLLELAKACVTAERLGSHDVPDLLVISFSSNDLIGHAWGPDSQEVLDVTLRSDALMAELLAFLDKAVGKDQYLVGVTADHGVCPLPEVVRQSVRGADLTPYAQRVDPAELRTELDKHLTARFPASKPADGKPAKWVEAVQFPWFYLQPELVKKVGTPRAAIAAEAARFLATRSGVARTFTQADLSAPIPETDPVGVRMKRSFFPARCGDVGVLLHQYCLPTKRLDPGTSHGTPYAYDTHVPLLVYGPGIRGGKRDEPTTPQALARIFAKWLGVRPPRDAAFPLPESLE